MHERTEDGRAFGLLTVLDASTRECLRTDVARRMNHQDVLERLAELFVGRGVPDTSGQITGGHGHHLRFLPNVLRIGVHGQGGQALAQGGWCEDVVHRAGSPWENGYVESFNGKLRDELLNVEVFETLKETQVLVERWRRAYNQRGPHSALAYQPPAPEARFPSSQTLSLPPCSGLQMLPELTQGGAFVGAGHRRV